MKRFLSVCFIVFSFCIVTKTMPMKKSISLEGLENRVVSGIGRSFNHPRNEERPNCVHVCVLVEDIVEQLREKELHFTYKEKSGKTMVSYVKQSSEKFMGTYLDYLQEIIGHYDGKVLVRRGSELIAIFDDCPSLKEACKSAVKACIYMYIVSLSASYLDDGGDFCKLSTGFGLFCGGENRDYHKTKAFLFAKKMVEFHKNKSEKGLGKELPNDISMIANKALYDNLPGYYTKYLSKVSIKNEKKVSIENEKLDRDLLCGITYKNVKAVLRDITKKNYGDVPLMNIPLPSSRYDSEPVKKRIRRRSSSCPEGLLVGMGNQKKKKKKKRPGGPLQIVGKQKKKFERKGYF